jgi:hypothetical protein
VPIDGNDARTTRERGSYLLGMSVRAREDIRNVAIIGHIDHGAAMPADRLMFPLNPFQLRRDERGRGPIPGAENQRGRQCLFKLSPPAAFSRSL